jgi:hypothetical protein
MTTENDTIEPTAQSVPPAEIPAAEEPAETAAAEEPAETAAAEEPTETAAAEEPAETAAAEEPAVTADAEEPAVTADAEEPAAATSDDSDDSAEEGSRPRRRRGRRKPRSKDASESDDGGDDSDDDATDGELPEGVAPWWNGWGDLRGFLVSATDRGAPHPDMPAAAEKLRALGGSVEALAVWVPTSDERSRLERSRRTVNAACDPNQDAAETLERVKEDLSGDGEVWDQLFALAEAWVQARRHGLEPARRGRRKGRNRGRNREREVEAPPAAKAQEPARETSERGRRDRNDRRRRRGRRPRQAAVPTGRWASSPVRSWARSEDEITAYVWFEPATDDAPGAVAGVLWTGWDPDADKLALAALQDFTADGAEASALENLAGLERCEEALPFRVATTETDATVAAAAALRLVFGWLLPDGEPAHVRVVLSHGGLQAAEVAERAEGPTAAAPADAGVTDDDDDGVTDDDAGETDAAEDDVQTDAVDEPDAVTDWTAQLAPSFADGGEALADHFARWTLDSAALLAAQPGDPEDFAPARLAQQGYLAYAQLVAATRPGGPLAAAADTPLGAPHFEGALPIGTDALPALESLAAIDRTAATDRLLELAPLLAGTALLDPVMGHARRRIGSNAGLQLKLLLGLEGRAKDEERDLPTLEGLVSAIKPLLGELPGATPARVRTLWLLGQARDARRHEELTEVAIAWKEQRDAAIAADPTLATHAVLAMSRLLCDRVDHVEAREMLSHLAASEQFGGLPVLDRCSVIGADARFAAALERLDSSDLSDEAKAAWRKDLLRLRALNAIDARLHADANTELDVPTEVIQPEPPPVEDEPAEEALVPDEDEEDAAADRDDDAEDSAAADDEDDDRADDDEPDDEARADDDEDEDDEDEDEDDEDEDDDSLDEDDSDSFDFDALADVLAGDDDDDDDIDDEPDTLPPELPEPIRNHGTREALGDTATGLVLAAIGAESLADAARELAHAEGREAEQALLLQLLWAREDLDEIEAIYLAEDDLNRASPSPEVDLYRGLLLFMAGKDRDSRKCVSRAMQTARESKATADRLRVAAFQVVSACIDGDESRGGKRASLRQLRERLPASALPSVDRLAAIQARPDEDKIDLALGTVPLTLR